MTIVQTLSGLDVLVLEDDFYLADDARRTLEEAGARVVGPFSDSGEAIVAADRRKPNCALIDINLGGGPNLAPARAMRARGVPIIFVTGYDSGSIPAEFAGATCLQKPVEPRQILNAVQSICLQ